MNQAVDVIPIARLAIAFLPALLVVGVLARWARGHMTAGYALTRMLGQLLLVGYFLDYVFESRRAWVVLSVLAVMVLAASWISLRTVHMGSTTLFRKALIAIAVGGGSTLCLITQGVLGLDPWYDPSALIPLAGMIFGSAMNSVSLAVERLEAELRRDVPFDEARGVAFGAALIPITNSLFAVGLVSLPGMMTGQILSGVSPMIAARYQIMVMCMIFGASGLAAAIFLHLRHPAPGADS